MIYQVYPIYDEVIIKCFDEKESENEVSGFCDS